MKIINILKLSESGSNNVKLNNLYHLILILILILLIIFIMYSFSKVVDEMNYSAKEKYICLQALNEREKKIKEMKINNKVDIKNNRAYIIKQKLK